MYQCINEVPTCLSIHRKNVDTNTSNTKVSLFSIKIEWSHLSSVQPNDRRWWVSFANTTCWVVAFLKNKRTVQEICLDCSFFVGKNYLGSTNILFCKLNGLIFILHKDCIAVPCSFFIKLCIFPFPSYAILCRIFNKFWKLFYWWVILSSVKKNYF